MSTENQDEEEADKYQPGCLVKSELVEAVAENIEISRNVAAHIVDVIFGSIVQALNRGDRVELRGFGIFDIANGGDAPDVIPRPVTPWPFHLRVWPSLVSERLGKTLNRP